ncbi:MAG: hypothetical protein PHP50_04235 [Lachnospiraceae bacterium]|nr:hypothetical protein [Lachnospiraceae bacterium]
MNIHINILLIVCIVVAFTRMVHGCKVGMVEELGTLGSILVSVVMLVLLLMTYNSIKSGNRLETLLSIILLLSVSIVYKIIKLVISPAKILAGLPIIHSVDQVCGIAFGLAETLIILWALESLVSTFGLGKAGAWITASVGDSLVLTYIFDHNCLTMIVPFLLNWLQNLKK